MTEFWRTEIKKAVTNKKNQRVVDMIIPDSATAVAVAEPILFKVYGKDEILGEKPYKVDAVDGYWVLTGTLPKGYFGGTFVIIMAAKDGRVIKLTHYK
ncbi:NTF2 fold immunity protein [Mucilaginibacter sp. AW1-7]|uniref:NTF2 fold immunity protein n=1 Tax=Mucilaginibacter sp. AW1-7 TaxID=3349874 RepID=UPI003F737D7F